jgi:hypothetical protein
MPDEPGRSSLIMTGHVVDKAIRGFRYCSIIAAIGGYSLMLLLCSHAAARASEPDEDYIERTFKQAISEIPRMAWLVKPDTIITDSKHENIFLYADEKAVLEARYDKTFEKVEIAEIRNRNYVACNAGKVYFDFRAATVQSGAIDRAFYTTKPFGKKVMAGYKNIRLSSAQHNKILSLNEISGKPGVHNYFAVALEGADFIYSFHALYDKKTRGLFRKGIALQNSEGRIIGSEFWDIDEDNLCDGCDLPEYRSEDPDNPQVDMVYVFNLINVFIFPGFEYPVLFMDTSTMEGRAISFATFDSDRRYDEYRDYEYVVTCILDSPY